MPQRVPITFLIDEHLPVDAFRRAAGPHVVVVAKRKTPDAAILRTAEENGQIVITADTWFLRELTRYPLTHKLAYRRAGVVQVPGEWEPAQRRLARFLPLIETMHHLAHAHALDHRVGVNLSRAEIRIFAPWD